MNFRPFTKIDRWQWAWMIQSYFRLSWVALMLKFAKADWLIQKIELTSQGSEHNGKADREAIDGHKNSTELDLILARGMHEAVRLAARLNFLKLECLPKSIVLKDMLEVRGVVATVKVGVAKDRQGGLASHAWVDVGGVMVAEPEEVQFQFNPVLK